MYNLIRIIIVGVLVYLIYKTLKWIFGPQREGYHHGIERRTTAVVGEDLVEDPYCHVYVPQSQAYRGYFDGREVYFCSRRCFDQYTSKMSANERGEAV